MLDQGCPIEFFRVQRSPFYIFYALYESNNKIFFLNFGKGYMMDLVLSPFFNVLDSQTNYFF
jgi:hypothetical protein